MEWVQTTGKTVEQALEAALDELGVHTEDVEFEVMEEPKAGLFGRFGGSEARIRTRLKPISREKPQDKRRGRTKGSGRRSDGSKRPRPDRQGSERQKSERQGSERQGSDRQKSANPPKPKQNEGAPRVDENSVSIEDQAAAAEEFVSGFVAAIGLDGDVTSTVDDDIIEIHVEGSELGLLVGPKAATLTAIEELTRAVVQREAGGHAARVRVDVGGYRAKRRAALEVFTRSIVEEVLSSGEARALEPMSSIDRKTVHDAVNEVDGVETSSEGEDARRHVVIRPT